MKERKTTMFRRFAQATPKPGASPLRRALGLTLAICATIALASSASRAEAQSLVPGQVVYLKCEAPTARDDRAIWLDGNTATGTVGLAPNTGFPYTGTKWTVFGLADGAIGLHCEGHLNGPRWLDGNTLEGTTWLRDSTAFPFTGTRWRVLELGNGKFKLLNLGHLGGADAFRYLDGVTPTKTTRLTNWDGNAGNVWSVWTD
jgi:hypothetical protein